MSSPDPAPRPDVEHILRDLTAARSREAAYPIAANSARINSGMSVVNWPAVVIA